MPKKEGVVKTYSFNKITISQINDLCNEYMLKPTSLIEFLVNKEYKQITSKKESN